MRQFYPKAPKLTKTFVSTISAVGLSKALGRGWGGAHLLVLKNPQGRSWGLSAAPRAIRQLLGWLRSLTWGPSVQHMDASCRTDFLFWLPALHTDKGTFFFFLTKLAYVHNGQ